MVTIQTLSSFGPKCLPGKVRFGGNAEIPSREALIQKAKHLLQAEDVSAFNELKAAWSKQFKERLDLRGIDLSGKTLNKVNLVEADLRDAVLKGAQLENAQLYGALLDKANLESANLTRAVLSEARMEQTNLMNVTAPRAYFINTILEGANLSHANLDHATAWYLQAAKADFSHAKLRAANLRGSLLKEATMRHADMPGINLANTRLNEAKLDHTNLEKAILLGSDLERATLNNARLTGANLLFVKNLNSATLDKTVLDSKGNIPMVSVAALEKVGYERTSDNRVLGYTAQCHPQPSPAWFEPGKTVKAPVFSVDSSAENHPGFVVFPTIKGADRHFRASHLVQVALPLDANGRTPGVLRPNQTVRVPAVEVIKSMKTL